MQPLWYGDRRDRVKWGALIHLATKYRIKHLFWIVYFRDPIVPTLRFDDDQPQPIEDAVWRHFSDLRRIRSLGKTLGITIRVIDHPFSHATRGSFRTSVLKQIDAVASPKLVFFDPDTGIALANGGITHATPEDIQEIWQRLKPTDVMAIYQHSYRAADWLGTRKRQLETLCSGVVHTVTSDRIARDVGILWLNGPRKRSKKRIKTKRSKGQLA